MKQAEVTDLPAWMTRGWPADRAVGESVYTSLAQDPEGVMGSEYPERLQEDKWNVREFEINK